MKSYKFLYIHYLSSNFGLFFIIPCFLVFFKIVGLIIYLLLISISAFIFFLRRTELIIKYESIIVEYKISEKRKIFDFQEIESINIIHRDYYICHTKTIELKFYNNKKYKISCNGIFEKDEDEEGMFHLYLFIKEKFENTFFLEYYIFGK